MTAPERWSRLRKTPEIVIAKGRILWSVHLDCGLTILQREDGGPFALTRKRAEAKGRRMLRRYLWDQSRPQREIRIPS